VTLPDLAPDLALERLAASGLRGRGGGWVEAARKWRAVRAEGGRPFVIANGAESEPGSFKDRYVLQHRAADVLAGLALAARGVGAGEAVVFLKRSLDAPARALERALSGSAPAGLSVRIFRGDEGYVAGEETALIESLEGRRAWPRPKPPLPAGVGYLGRPTLVHNVETLARLPAALADPAAFRRSESTFVTVWGDVARPGVHEVPLGTPVDEVIHRAGGALEPVGLAFPGGPASRPLTVDELDLPLEPAALRAAGSALGAATLLVVGASACPLAVAASLTAFYQREACGQCPPCTIGSASLARIVRGFEEGGSRPRDLRDLAEVAAFMGGHGYCAHGRTAAEVTTGIVRHLGAAFAAHLAAGRCPWPERRHPDPFASGSPELTRLEAAVLEQLQ
jgi:NADH:ubiquinone oxidoreductase subunit F (NADH-binding)